MIASWKQAARLSRAIFWLGFALIWTGAETVEVVRELRNGPGQEQARRREVAAQLALAVKRPDCLRMLPEGALCRREAGHPGPCSTSSSAAVA